MNTELVAILALFVLFFIAAFVALSLMSTSIDDTIANIMGFLTGTQNTNIGGANGWSYPLVKAEGSGCVNPDKEGAPPEWVIGSADGKGACFWEVEPLFGTFGESIKISMLNLTVSPNSVSVNEPLEVLTSDSETCYDEALGHDFSSYGHYAMFVPDVANSFKGYVVSDGIVSARCVAVRDLTNDGYGYYIDSIGVYQQ